MQEPIEKSESVRLLKNFEKSGMEQLVDALMEDQIEYGQNIQDLDKYNRKAYNVSDSDEDEAEHHSSADVFPSINVYHDIGPLSRDFLKIKDEKALRKKISRSCMNNYWNKSETKELTEDILIGYIANKIPVTPLLFTLKLNNERSTVIKSDIDYSQTSDSEDCEEDNEEDEMTSIHYEPTLTMSKQSSIENKGYQKHVVENTQLQSVIGDQKSIIDNNKTETMPSKPNNFVINEEVEFSGEEVNISMRGQIPVSGANPNANNRHLPHQKYNTEVASISNTHMNTSQPMQMFEINEEIRYDRPAPNLSNGPLVANANVNRRQSKSSVLIKLLQKENGLRNRKYSKDMVDPDMHYDAKPPLVKVDSLRKDSPLEKLSKNPSLNSIKQNSIEKSRGSNPNLEVINNSQSGLNRSKNSNSNQKLSLNSSMNESEYSKNFRDLVEGIEVNIHKRRRLKIVPYSKNERKKLLKQIETDMALITRMMKNRKDHFKSACDDQLFKKASKFHTEVVNEKIKARFLAYLIKEYGKAMSMQMKATKLFKNDRKSSRKRSASKPLSSRKVSPENYMINIVESEVPAEAQNRDSLILSKETNENKSATTSSMPTMQKIPSFNKRKESKLKEEIIPQYSDEINFFHESSSTSNYIYL